MPAPPAIDYAEVRDELAHQSPREIAAMFGRVAPRYDRMNHLLCGSIDVYWRWCLARAVARQRPARLLDLATGSGDVLLALARHRAYTETAIGADFCLPMLQRARAKGANRLLAGDGLHLPFAPATFDAVTISFGLRNFADRSAGLREMRRVLRPGGRAYILEFSTPVAPVAPLYFWYPAPHHAALRPAHHDGTRRLRIPGRIDPRLPTTFRIGHVDSRRRFHLGELDASDFRHRRPAHRRRGMIELTQGLLADLGGWPALKEARRPRPAPRSGRACRS